MPSETILIIEDDPQIAQAMVYRLKAEGFFPIHATNTAQASQQIASTRPDLMILDVGLPGEDGFTWLAGRPDLSQFIPTLMLTARGTTEDKVKGLGLGADDYLTKPFEFAELLARIQAVLRRRPPPQGNTLKLGNLLLKLNEKRVCIDEQDVDLSPREYDVLTVLAEQPHHVISKAQILQRLADRDLRAADLNDSTIEVIIHRMRKKLEGATVQIETARGFGYILK